MKAIARTFLSLAAALLFVSSARAVTCYALTDTKHLLRFDSATPGTVTDLGLISGVTGYSLVGLDTRTTIQTVNAANPGVGSLWAIGYVGSLFQLFVITPSTPPSATPIGSPLAGINNSAGDSGWGFGFDPAADRIHFIGVQFNYEINPNTATYVQQTSFAGFPAYSGAAYTTASFGGTSTFYNIDRGTSPDVLQTSTNINSASISTVGTNLGFDFSPPAAMDIYQDTFLLASSGVLYSVNRTTGTATMINNIQGGPTIRGLAIMPPTFPPTLPVTVKITGKKRVVTTKAVLVVKGTAASQAGIKLVQYKVGKAGFKNAIGTTSWRARVRLKPGLNLVSVQATGGNDAKSAIAKVRIIRQ
jgi:hypothetical protein